MIIFYFLTPFFKYSEFGLTEILQALILGTSLLIHLSCIKYFLKFSNIYIFITRFIMLLFLFYEEISFFSLNFIRLPTSINLQSELNIHNSIIANQILLKIPLPFTNHVSSINVIFFTYYVFSFFLGCGLFLPYLKRFRYLFWEKEFAIFSFFTFGNMFVSGYVREVFNTPYRDLVHIEYTELLMYIIFLLDVVQKRKMMKNIYNNEK